MWILRTNLRPVSPAGQAFRTKRGKRFTGMTNGLTHWVPVFSPSCSRMLGNGGRTSIRLLISSKGCAPSIRSIPKELILPLVVVDIHEEAAKNPDYTFSLDRVKKWEKDHGQIPAGAFVAMRTDWSKRWPDAARWKQRCERCCQLSRLDLARSKIPLRRP